MRVTQQFVLVGVSRGLRSEVLFGSVEGFLTIRGSDRDSCAAPRRRGRAAGLALSRVSCDDVGDVGSGAHRGGGPGVLRATRREWRRRAGTALVVGADRNRQERWPIAGRCRLSLEHAVHCARHPRAGIDVRSRTARQSDAGRVRLDPCPGGHRLPVGHAMHRGRERPGADVQPSLVGIARRRDCRSGDLGLAGEPQRDRVSVEQPVHRGRRQGL